MPAADAYFDQVPPPHRFILLELRQLILGLDDAMQEHVKWSHPVYTAKRNLFMLAAHKQHVNLQVFNGAHLEDPGGLLEGTGKSMRHIKFRSLEDVANEAVAPLLKQAITADQAA